MSTVSASAIASLRSRTGVSISAVKDALEEANGDEEKAIELLRKRGIAQAAKKADRNQGEGGIFVAEGNGKAAMVLVLCETDFVSRGDAFQALGQELAQTLLNDGDSGLKSVADDKLPAAVQALGENITLGETHIIESPTIGSYVHSNGKIGVLIGLKGGNGDMAKDIGMHAAAMNPSYVRPEDVTQESIDSEKGIWKEQLLKEGKPENMIDKIMGGKEKKFREDSALLKQSFVKDPSKTIEEFLGDATVEHYLRISLG